MGNRLFLGVNIPLSVHSILGIAVTIGLMIPLFFVPQLTIAENGIENERDAQYVAGEIRNPVKTIKALITAYSSTPDQTDDDPFTTASGKFVEDGIVANNMLPFGTEIRIPSLYGDKVFVVQDRMHSRKSNYHFDVWMTERSLAKNFGVKIAEIEILESGK